MPDDVTPTTEAGRAFQNCLLKAGAILPTDTLALRQIRAIEAEARLGELAEYAQARGTLEQAVVSLTAQLAEAREARDWAVAHDRQPYPTAAAYEGVCTALHSKEAQLAEKDGIIAALAAELRDYANAERERWDEEGVWSGVRPHAAEVLLDSRQAAKEHDAQQRAKGASYEQKKLRKELRAAVTALPQPTLGLAGGVNRGAVIDEIERVFRAALLAPQEPEETKCPTCNGQGWVEGSESYSEADHAPDCVGYCRNCPVEVQRERQTQEQCPDCVGTGLAHPGATEAPTQEETT
jgi:hypothetical protein